MQGHYDTLVRTMINTEGYEIFSYEPTTHDGIVFLHLFSFKTPFLISLIGFYKKLIQKIVTIYIYN